MRFKEHYLSEQECPLTREYGGIPDGGGYDSNIEYEIGAQHMAEALHCILGSIVKQLRRDHSSGGELEHILEEIDLVSKDQEEYSRDLYNGRLFNDRLPDKDDKYVHESLQSIRENSPKLIDIATKAKATVKTKEPKILYDMAMKTYDTLIVLAEEMLESVKEIPITNAFKSYRLRKNIIELEDLITEYENKI